MRHIEELAQVPLWCPFFSAPLDYARSLSSPQQFNYVYHALASYEPLRWFPCFLELSLFVSYSPLSALHETVLVLLKPM